MNNEEKLVEVFFPAFFGAFCAFVFFRLGEFLNRVVQRKYLHITALVKIERVLNDNYDIFHGNNFQVENILAQNEKAKILGIPSFSGNKLHKVYLDDAILNDLANIDFYNDIFSFKIEIRRFNFDIDTTFSVIEHLRDAHLNKLIDKETYCLNYNNMLTKLDDLKKFNNHLLTDTKELLAKARVLQRQDKSLIQKFYSFLIKRRYNKKFHKKYTLELQKVNSEIEMIKKKKQDKLNHIFK